MREISLYIGRHFASQITALAVINIGGKIATVCDLEVETISDPRNLLGLLRPRMDEFTRMRMTEEETKRTALMALASFFRGTWHIKENADKLILRRDDDECFIVDK